MAGRERVWMGVVRAGQEKEQVTGDTGSSRMTLCHFFDWGSPFEIDQFAQELVHRGDDF